MSGSIVRAAHAKVNAFLRVLGRRDDGYHAVETLILPVSLHDVVTVEPADELSIALSGEAEGVPAGESNLALRAARALAAEAGGAASDRGARITIEKRIPVAAGLGGGSADAAATLLALDELWGLEAGPGTLARIGLAVGSDVPALLLAEPVFAAGRGEVVEPVVVQPTSWVLKPLDRRVSAADAYAWWDDEPGTGPDAGALIAAAESGADDLLGSALFNDLQRGVEGRHPEVGAAVETFLSAGALGAVMSGSGPTVAALCSFATAPSIAAAIDGAVLVDAPPAPQLLGG
ncbi:MAG TPA: 4-(cytidine 5'-diphospho)-2-C-methyl-D-erythritol kinase [Actinomycetota bacterium]|nr:4-(cytidine 5'-diphospho)-2-C-methyl-D-erythritol kinase [Actinomycetota bacterium]